MKFFGNLKFFGNIRRQDKASREEKELEEFNKRQEKYNDMLRDEAQKQRFMNKMSKIKSHTFTKKMVIIIIGMCIIDIQLSYVLAFLDKANPISDLSVQLCITILGVAFVYMIRAYFDSKAEHRNLDHDIKSEIESSLSNKINDLFNSAGINVDANEFLHTEEEEPPDGLNINIPLFKKKDEDDNGVG